MPDGDLVRPTSDRVREAWMSIVTPHLPGARVLDLFAGSGALGIEALSRGAVSADLVETSPIALAAIDTNVRALGAGADARIHRTDVIRFIEGLDAHAYDLAFADPPYDRGLGAAVAEHWRDTPFADVLGVEHRAFDKLPEGGTTRRYGTTAITFYHATGGR